MLLQKKFNLRVWAVLPVFNLLSEDWRFVCFISHKLFIGRICFFLFKICTGLFCHFSSGSNCHLLACCPPVYLQQEQASWVCRCEDRVVQRLEQDFKLTLQQQNSLEQWAAWLDGVVSQVLKPYQHSPAFPKAAKLFLLKWSFYRSDDKTIHICYLVCIY